MELNKEIKEVLKTYNIDIDSGILCLLGIYHGLDVERIVSQEIIQQINLTKIVEKDYSTETLTWNIPIYAGQETAFDWVTDWMKPFGLMNPERRGVAKDCISRMKRFFMANPQYRKEDVYAARDAYLATVKDSQYLKSSHKFIYDGQGSFRSSMLEQYCEQIKGAESNSYQKGKVM